MVTITRGEGVGVFAHGGVQWSVTAARSEAEPGGGQRGRVALRNGLSEHLGLLVCWSGPGPDLQRWSQRSSQPVPLLHFGVEAMRYRSDGTPWVVDAGGPASQVRIRQPGPNPPARSEPASRVRTHQPGPNPPAGSVYSHQSWLTSVNWPGSLLVLTRFSVAAC